MEPISERVQTLLVESSQPQMRLDVYLRDRLPEVSRGTLQRLIEGGQIRVDGQRVKLTHSPRAGETITIDWPKPRPAETEAQDIPLDVLFEDDHLLVVNKSPDLAVHPSAGHEDQTLVNALLHHCRGRLSGIGGVARPGIVHRLDLETSGCLVVAKDDPTHTAIATQFAQREVRKVYHALVCGQVRPSQGDIRTGIARHPTHRKRMAVTDGTGREAWTSYRVLEQFGAVARVEVELHTGRTHQVRVHFQFCGFPLVGDAIYGKRANQRLSEQTGYVAPRHMLHAFELGFVHPATGERVTFQAPWPADFCAAVERFRSSQGASAGDSRRS